MRQLTAVTTVLITAWVEGRYATRIRAKKVTPSIVTWFLFCLGAVVSYLTFSASPNSDLVGNTTNTLDVLLTSSIVVVLGIYGEKEQWRFEWLDLVCLLLALAVLVYWLEHRAIYLKAHLAIQGIFIIAYWPTVKRLWYSRVNTEDFWYWAAGCCASVLGLGLAVSSHKLMPMVYAGRSVLSQILILLLMFRLRRKWKIAIW